MLYQRIPFTTAARTSNEQSCRAGSCEQTNSCCIAVSTKEVGLVVTSTTAQDQTNHARRSSLFFTVLTWVRLLQWTPACSVADGEASTGILVAGDLPRRSGVASIATAGSLCRSRWALIAGDLSPATFRSGRLKCSRASMRGGCKRFVAIESKSFDLTIVGTAQDVDRGKQRVITELGMRAPRSVSIQVYSRRNSSGNRRNMLRDSNRCSSEGGVCTNWPPDALLVCDTSSPSTDEAKCVDLALYEAKICGQAASNTFVPLARDAVVSHQVHKGLDHNSQLKLWQELLTFGENSVFQRELKRE
ncbi:hypothetical protein Cgig2_022553 [Carnegiea gigantea]|uniref:Uncharacterized protein n=1 Tax=Carnegiea gigantea TaxID=171969 RepID=A0A9Q1QJL4_9CARY|nr:hypothetical protein Cgig2_022553 [Carnegiea gigantea]